MVRNCFENLPFCCFLEAYSKYSQESKYSDLYLPKVIFLDSESHSANELRVAAVLISKRDN